MVHVELCARMAMELGGGTEILHEPDQLTKDPDPSFRALVRAAELVTRFFCVGEALSIPLLRGTWRAARHPLARAVLGRIVKDEAAHGAFGWTFLDWAVPELKAEEIEHLRLTADHAISLIYDLWADIRRRPRVATGDHHPLGWLETDAYLALAQRSLAQKVIAPLRERGIAVQPLRPPV
jgi:hypothetical protein